MPRRSQKNLKKVTILSNVQREEGVLCDSHLEKITMMRTRAWISRILSPEMGPRISFKISYQKVGTGALRTPAVQCLMQFTTANDYFEARSMSKDPLKALRICFNQIDDRLASRVDLSFLLPSGVEFAEAG